MIATIINWIFQLIFLLILARVVVSFLPLDPSHRVVRTIYNLTEPMLAPIRRYVRPTAGFDFSPMLLLLLLFLLRSLLFSFL